MSMVNLLNSTIKEKKSFFIFSVIYILYNTLGNFFLYSPGSVDYWEHMASMNSFSINLFSPPNPYLISGDPTHLHTPYHLFWGLISNILNIHVIYLFPIIALVNSFLFIISINLFSIYIFNSERYALYLSLTMLLFWIYAWGYSGVYNLSLLPLTITYPYWFTFPLSLLLITFFGVRIKNNNFSIGSFISTTFLISIIFLSHPLSGAFLIIVLIIKILTLNQTNFSQKVLLFIPAFLGIFISFFWPYFPVFKAIVGSNSYAQKGFADSWELFYKFSVVRVLPSLIGISYILKKTYKTKLDFLSTSIIFFLGIYILNYFLLHNTVFSRFIIYLAFFGHIGIVIIIKDYEFNYYYKKILTTYILSMLLLGVPQLINSVLRLGPINDLVNRRTISLNSNFILYKEFKEFSKFISKNSVVLAPLKESWVISPITGCKVVGVIHSNPFMDDYYERLSDTKKFFSIDTVKEIRDSILEKYNVNFLLIPIEDLEHMNTYLQGYKKLLDNKKFILYKVSKDI